MLEAYYMSKIVQDDFYLMVLSFNSFLSLKNNSKSGIDIAVLGTFHKSACEGWDLNP